MMCFLFFRNRISVIGYFGKCSPKKGKNALNLFFLLRSEAKGSNKFCKGMQFNCLPLQNCFPLQNWLLSSQNVWYFPFRN